MADEVKQVKLSAVRAVVRNRAQEAAAWAALDSMLDETGDLARHHLAKKAEIDQLTAAIDQARAEHGRIVTAAKSDGAAVAALARSSAEAVLSRR